MSSSNERDTVQKQLGEILKSQQQQQKEISLLRDENKSVKRKLERLINSIPYVGNIPPVLRLMFVNIVSGDLWSGMTGNLKKCQDPFLNFTLSYLDEFDGARLTQVCKDFWCPQNNTSLIEKTSSHTERLPNFITCSGPDAKKLEIDGLYYKEKESLLVRLNNGIKKYSPEKVIYINSCNPHLFIELRDGVWSFSECVGNFRAKHKFFEPKIITKTKNLVGGLFKKTHKGTLEISSIEARLNEVWSPVSFKGIISGEFLFNTQNQEYRDVSVHKTIKFLNDKKIWEYVDHTSGKTLESLQNNDLYRVTYWRDPKNNSMIKVLPSIITEPPHIDMDKSNLEVIHYRCWPQPVKEKYMTFMRIKGILGQNKICNGVYKLDSHFRNGRPQYNHQNNNLNMHFYPLDKSWIIEEVKLTNYGKSRCLTPRSIHLPESGIWYVNKYSFSSPHVLDLYKEKVHMIECQVTVEYADSDDFDEDVK